MTIEKPEKKRIPLSREELLMRFREYKASGDWGHTPPVRYPEIVAPGDIIRVINLFKEGFNGTDYLVTGMTKPTTDDGDWTVHYLEGSNYRDYSAYRNNPGKMAEYAILAGLKPEGVLRAAGIEARMRDKPVEEMPSRLDEKQVSARVIGIQQFPDGDYAGFILPVLVGCSLEDDPLT